MSERFRFLLATSCGLVLAAAAHIAIVLAVPRFAEQDAFGRLTLRLYDTPAALGTGAVDARSLPAVERVECGA